MKKLEMVARDTARKSDAKKLRREGAIPAIIYGHKDKNAESIAVKNSELTSLMRQLPPGRLSTTVFTLVDANDKKRRVIIKDIQYKVTNYEIIHIDFEELRDNTPISVNVPIEFTGVVDCIGVKLGGVLRQVIRTLRVRCLPKDMPSVFEIDVKNMNLGESKKLADLDIPAHVRPIANMNEIAVAIARR